VANVPKKAAERVRVSAVLKPDVKKIVTARTVENVLWITTAKTVLTASVITNVAIIAIPNVWNVTRNHGLAISVINAMNAVRGQGAKKTPDAVKNAV